MANSLFEIIQLIVLLIILLIAQQFSGRFRGTFKTFWLPHFLKERLEGMPNIEW